MSTHSTNNQSGKRHLILVTAATAPVGRSIVEQLVAMGHPVRTLTRDPKKAGLLAPALALCEGRVSMKGPVNLSLYRWFCRLTRL